LADALFVTAEEGSTWTLINPFYTEAMTQPSLFKEYLSYPVAMGDTDFIEYINHWIQMQHHSGAQQKEYDYWILGKQPFGKQQRWSVIRDVLH
jgi:ABC-type amino acid transport substrate-binding protein